MTGAAKKPDEIAPMFLDVDGRASRSIPAVLGNP